MRKLLLFAATMLFAVSCIEIVVPTNEGAGDEKATTEPGKATAEAEKATTEPGKATAEAEKATTKPEKATAGAVEKAVLPRVYSNSYDGYLNVRAKPATNSKVLGVLYNGPEGAELLGVVGKWSKVRVNGVVGYVSSAYIQSKPTEYVYINASSVVGDWYWNRGSWYENYTIESNGKFCYESSGMSADGTWSLSGNKLILKFADGSIVTADVYGKTIRIDGKDYGPELPELLGDC